MARGIWVFAEQRNGELKKVVFELLSEGRKIADQLGQELWAILLGKEVKGLVEKLAPYGADKVLVADDEKLEKYSTGTYTKVISDLIREHQPFAFFLGNTAMGKDLAPRVAERVGTGLSSDCTGIELVDGNLHFVRPIYAGKAFAKTVCPEARPVMATIRPNVFPVSEPDAARQAEVVEVPVQVGMEDLKAIVKEVVKQASGRVELTEADIIVSGGRGMKGPENFKILEELADVLGAAVGASRAAVDAGWREHQYQVGQTGKTVSPSLYIACGISGAIQHLAGMSSSKVIVAINKDPEANIFKVADYGIVGDLFEIVPLLTEEFKKLLA
ncbi:electron transfer flavoprotein subunit alpha/FixB family protein [Calderihabitans maritimus]|uniref:Electron transfer flavoprotein, alpha subunit n=1 Tax=Calderihabitans maritimus TaxID=1246530 RepID=A0A1Z5HUA0_9FIRM|nr:electron transfer flavoprotein subunit alpha/FixB family protein [Calderihabitans maritimus]GAW93113.1 electron transfer flavoprotein, alpha subunit [Calderihabitans maritimus]